MKNLFRKLKYVIKKGFEKVGNSVSNLMMKWTVRRNAFVANRAGEGYIDTAIKIIIALVIGALLLGGLYTLFSTSVIPTMQTKVTDMFSYTGA